MKKILLFTTLIISLFLLVGCNLYEDTTKKNMKLIDVKVFDENNNEVIGSYKNYFEMYDLSFTPLNSAAPVLNFYVVEAQENKSYTVKFFLYSERGYELTKLIVNESFHFSESTILECTDIEKEGKNFVVTFNVQNTDENHNLYRVYKWYNNDASHPFSTQGSNTYIAGVYFKLPSKIEVAC